ncbi:purine and uridine phosphorylase [Aspergillus carlsbadensis]|nr:purine and uridine phosphorylase [Aspergillus carlsbadensis]
MQAVLLSPATKERAKGPGLIRAPAREGSSSWCIKLLLNILRILREIVDSLERAESCHNLRLFYLQLNANALLLRDYILPRYTVESTIDFDYLARPLLNKISSCLRCPFIGEGEISVPSSKLFPQLVALEQYWDKPGPHKDKLQRVKEYLDFSCQERRDELVLLLRGCVATLRSQCLDGSTDGAEEESHQHWGARRMPSYPVSKAANSLCQALVACASNCSSIHDHNYATRLRMATHKSRRNEGYAFETFVTMSLLSRSWQEALIQVNLSDPSPKSQPTVRFALPDHDGTNDKRPAATPRFAVKRLCEQISKMRQNPSMRMNLTVEEGRLWKEKSSRSDMAVNRAEPAISLEEIIRDCPSHLTEKVKRVLAVLIAYSIFHLRGTQWLRADRFTATNILFFRTPNALPLKPYIQLELRDMGTECADRISDLMGSEPEIDPDDLPLHPYPELIMLSIMLMELYMRQPIKELAERGGMEVTDWNTLDSNTRYAVAATAFECCKTEFPDKYRGSIDKCLDPNIGLDRNDNQLDDQGLKFTIYENIIRPLEDELDSGFGNTVSVETLDEAAESMDLSAWGQTYKTKLLSSITDHSAIFNSSIPMKRPYSESGETNYATHPVQSPGRAHPDLLSHEIYTVGWICALPKEMAASLAMLDETHPRLPQDESDPNSYTLGRIGAHNVVMACLPAGVTGTISASRVGQQMRSTFKGIRFGLIVGIGGGVPGSKDIRLGDVVVGEPCDTFGGVIQYDFGKTVEDCKFRRTGSLNRPPDVLLTAVSRLRANHYYNRPLLNDYLQAITERLPESSAEFSHPGPKSDLLFNCEYDHVSSNPDGSCEDCNATELVSREARKSTSPQIHYGLIASGNQVMRHGLTRDRLRKDLNVLCFEMEAAGLMDIFPCLVIRGICDYADSHKSKTWQGYAAAVAAAYAKELLGVVSSG